MIEFRPLTLVDRHGVDGLVGRQASRGQGPQIPAQRNLADESEVLPGEVPDVVLDLPVESQVAALASEKALYQGGADGREDG